MKKILAIALSVLAFAAVASAQPRAIGIRAGYDAELSYQHSLGQNFLEFDLGAAGYKDIVVSGIYDFCFGLADGFNFFVGPGAQVGMYKYAKADEAEGTHIGVGLGGNLGIEYQFSGIPFNISLDWRPMWDFLGAGGHWSSANIGFRYRF